jgi:integrase
MYERTGDPMYPVWYTRAPLGKNTLSNLMTNISKLAHLSMNYTNHSIRATSITEMDEAGVASGHIMRISGHKSEASIKNYSNGLSDKKKRRKYLTVLATL